MTTGGRPINILLIEDNPGDVRLTVEGLREAKLATALFVATDGADGLDMLMRRGTHAGLPAMDLVLLDLNLPRLDGREVLQAMRAEPSLHLTPVVVLTSSKTDEDVLRSYELRANAFITKPLQASEYLAVIRRIEDFWLQIVRLP
jgi:CheY-like chemotaxis protein